LGLYISIVPLFIEYLPPWFLIVHFMLLSADTLLLFSSRCPGMEMPMLWLRVWSVVLSVMYFLNTGMLTLLGSVIVVTFFIGLLRRGWKMTGFAILLTILVCATQSVKNDFRMLIRTYPELALTDRFGTLTELISARYLGEPNGGDVPWDARWEMLLSGFSRAGDDSMERVLEATPKRVPFWGGETYAGLPFLFIPRALWKDKPSRHFWNKYGRVYGVLSDDDFATSVGVSYLAEGYMNFGYPGLYGVAVLVGFLIAFMERFAYIALGGYFYFSFLLFLLPLMPAGTDLGSMLNSLFMMVVLTPFIRQVMSRSTQKDDYS
jgi:hypothetical protein